MSSLGDKIQEKIAKGKSFIVTHKNDLEIAAGIVQGENNVLKWVLGELDEATNQIQELFIERTAKILKMYPFSEVPSEEEDGLQKLKEEVLSVLEGQKK